MCVIVKCLSLHNGLPPLVQAESDMEGVHFEKKQLLAQWKSSLTAIQRWVFCWLLGWQVRAAALSCKPHAA